MHLSSVAGGQCHWKEPEAGHKGRHQYRPQARNRGLTRRLWQWHSLFSQMLSGTHPNQSVQHGDTKQSDESHTGGDTEGHMPQFQSEDSSTRGHGYGEKDQHGQTRGLEGRVEQQKDQHKNHRGD